jgi:isocitrate dehydrogenase (NAD+)
VHGSAPKYVGQNRVNPLATLRSAKAMLDYMGLHEDADRMQRAIEEALKNPETRTKDLGGTAGTKEFTQAIVSNLQQPGKAERVVRDG